MQTFTSDQAAKWLGLSREAVDAAAREGRLPVLDSGPRRFSREVLEEFHRARVGELVATLARSRETPAGAARRVRRALDAAESGVPRTAAVKLAAVPQAYRRLFSRPELAAAAVADGCRWCRGLEFAAVLGARPPEYGPALRELFGQDPCERCGPGLLRPFMASLTARVRAGGARSSGAPLRPSEVERAAAAEWARRRAVAASAGPVGDDNGKAMVAKRLRETRARLKDARRRGDRSYATELRALVASLEADAARVDGRTVARPGS